MKGALQRRAGVASSLVPAPVLLRGLSSVRGPCRSPFRPSQLPGAPTVRVAETIVTETATANGKSVSSDERVTQDPAPETELERFVWTKHWYPVASLLELDPSRPTQITLLGEDYVLWKDGSGNWRAFADRCPHRLAPLSEGRVESDGTLLCAYHAWRFDGSGACTRIPQAKDEQQETQARNNPRACATAFPTKVEQDMVWLWPEPGALAELESSTVPLPLDPDTLKGDPNVFATHWRCQELPYSADFFFENVLDPAHVPVAHHKIVGDRYKDAGPLNIDVDQPMSVSGFSFRQSGRTQDGELNRTSSRNSFVPPNCVLLEAYPKEGGKVTLNLYAYPTKPGFCRHVGRQVLTKNSKGEYPQGLSIFANPKIPKWLLHLLGNGFLIQDTVFLHWQDRITAQKQFRDKGINDKYFIPTSADKMILSLHKWYERYSPEGIPYKGEYEGQQKPPAERNVEVLWDTWEGHTKHCKVCRDAVEGLKKARVAAWVVCAIAAVQMAVVTAASASAAAATASAAPAAALPPLAGWLWAALAVAAAGVANALAGLIGRFYKWPYSHQDNN